MFSIAKFIFTLCILNIVYGKNKVDKINLADVNKADKPANLNLIQAKRDLNSGNKVTIKEPTDTQGRVILSDQIPKDIESKNYGSSDKINRELKPKNAFTNAPNKKVDHINAPIDTSDDKMAIRNAPVDLNDSKPRYDKIGDVSQGTEPTIINLKGEYRYPLQGEPRILPKIEWLDLPQEKTSLNWPMGIVPYYVNRTIYDDVIVNRMTEAIDHIESVSCILFKEINHPIYYNGPWLHITNPDNVKECVHDTPDDPNANDQIKLVIGFDCIRPEEMLHTLLHGVGLHDEVTHPHRDQYVRVLWENIQPKYRHLYGIRHTTLPHTLTEYDPSSIMHFHDRAFSANGGATVAALIPGLMVSPKTTLSQLDVMKLELSFGHGCKKRQVNGLIDTCKDALPGGSEGTEPEHGNKVSSSSSDSEEDKKSAEHNNDKSAKDSSDKESEEVRETTEYVSRSWIKKRGSILLYNQ